ncbi:MAG: hypothetical protein KKB13_06180, partial [Chloroflexi bacterium]|nr:hypothetical protein [Chloroflexota bacterium]
DVHTRRGLVDALPHLLRQDPAAAMHLVNRIIIHDEDAYIQERVWRVLLERGELDLLAGGPGESVQN